MLHSLHTRDRPRGEELTEISIKHKKIAITLICPAFLVRNAFNDCGKLYFFVFVFVHIYPPFTRKRIVSLYFGRDVRTRLGVAIFEVSGPPIFHIKAGASR